MILQSTYCSLTVVMFLFFIIKHHFRVQEEQLTVDKPALDVYLPKTGSCQQQAAVQCGNSVGSLYLTRVSPRLTFPCVYELSNTREQQQTCECLTEPHETLQCFSSPIAFIPSSNDKDLSFCIDFVVPCGQKQQSFHRLKDLRLHVHLFWKQVIERRNIFDFLNLFAGCITMRYSVYLWRRGKGANSGLVRHPIKSHSSLHLLNDRPRLARFYALALSVSLLLYLG